MSSSNTYSRPISLPPILSLRAVFFSSVSVLSCTLFLFQPLVLILFLVGEVFLQLNLLSIRKGGTLLIYLPLLFDLI